jgi:hypothetical protein
MAFSAALQAEVAELADALDSGSSARKGVRVQIPASAPTILSSKFNNDNAIGMAILKAMKQLSCKD